jgi:hypothetical protein
MLLVAEAPALRLQKLLQGPEACQLLQQMPPAVLTPEQYDLLASSHALCVMIITVVKQQQQSVGHTLGLLLRQQAARSAGTLVTWLQQRPEQLQFSLLQQRLDSNRACNQTINTAEVWVRACECVVFMSAALVEAAQAPQAGCSNGSSNAAAAGSVRWEPGMCPA